jgi:hypothetical protein
MSGPNQHHIPRALLRGFRIPDDVQHTYVFHAKGPPFPARIKKFAAEPGFYSSSGESGNSTLDDLITEYENRVLHALADYRAMRESTAVDVTAAATLVTHLTIRNAQVRETFALGITELVSGYRDILAAPGGLWHLMGFEEGAASPMFRKIIEDALPKAAAARDPGIPRSTLERMVFTAMREKFEELTAGTQGLAGEMTAWVSQAPKMMADAHVKALTLGLAPPERVAGLARLRWSVLPLEGGGLILPDCVALGREVSGSFQPLILLPAQKVALVVLPVSSNRLLLGTDGTCPLPEPLELRHLIAQCSHSFFVSPVINPELIDLCAEIGTGSCRAIHQAVAGALENYRPPAPLTEPPSLPPVSRPHPPLPCQVVFAGCADQNTAEAIADAMSRIVSAAMSHVSLVRLDGITVTEDLTSAWTSLERGFTRSGSVITTTDYGCVAEFVCAPLVMREDSVKAHLIVRADVGQALIGSDEPAKATAMHALMHGLGHVAFAQVFDDCLPCILLRPAQQSHEAILFYYIDGVFADYYAARFSAPLLPAHEARLLEWASQDLRSATEAITKARATWVAGGQDAQSLVDIAFPAAAQLVLTCARLIGHRDGLGESDLNRSTPLYEALEQAGLRKWLEHLQLTLRKLWDGQSVWRSFSEFLTLVEALERVLWEFRLVSWRDAESGRFQIKTW